MVKNKSEIVKFKPFTHDNLQIKNELLSLARKAREDVGDTKLQSNLASVLIYSSIAEYLAENLLENLVHYVKTSTYNNFAGILFLEKFSNKEGRMNLGSLIFELKKFNFPDKNGVIQCFEKICKARNRLFHNFAKSDLDSIVELLSKDLPVIQGQCEELITKINIIYIGLGKILIPGDEKVE